MTVHGSDRAPSAAGVPITDLFAVREYGMSPAVMAASGGGSRGFGGHVAAVALAAAYATVPQGLSVHHVHVEFLRPAISGRPLRAPVTGGVEAAGPDSTCWLENLPPHGGTS